MPDNLVQIGSFTMSRVVLDVLAILCGAIVGGLITFFAMRAIERQRWRQDKADRLAQMKREALAHALEWLDPMDRAISRASTLTSAFLQGTLEHEELMKGWPALLSQLAPRDIPPRLRVFLPKGAYAKGNAIVLSLDRLLTETVRSGQELRLGKDRSQGWENCFTQVTSIQEAISTLKHELEAHYKETFD